MGIKVNNRKYHKYVLIGLVFSVVIASIKSIFTDYNYDSGYAVATAYRIIRGEALFVTMWEPHQTSAFLCALLMRLYMAVTGTTTGVVLYLHIMGIVLRVLVTTFFYHSMKELLKKDILYLMCILLMVMSPKGVPMPEFSNMQLWFSVGLFCCLVNFLHNQSKYIWLVGAAIFLCLEILAYPTCIIVYPCILLLLVKYGSYKWRDCLLFSVSCLVCGLSYFGYFAIKHGLLKLVENLGYIVSGDNSHSQSLWGKWQGYFQEIGNMALQMLVIGFLVFVVVRLITSIMYRCGKWQSKEGKNEYWIFWYFLLFFICDLFQTLTIGKTYNERLPIVVPVIVLAFSKFRYCNKTDKQIVVIGWWISFLGFVATLMLTNLKVNYTLSYLVLAVMVSFIPIVRWGENTPEIRKKQMIYGVCLLFCLTTIIRSIYVIKCMDTSKTSILDIQGIVKKGPVIGMMSEYMGPYMRNTTYDEWKKYIQKGDVVLIVGGESYDPILYLYEDVEISVASTICTPTYNEMLLKYWEENPQKEPNVVVLECWFGESHVDKESWIMKWIETEFGYSEVIDGSYWRYYRRY